MKSFLESGLKPEILRAIDEMGFEKPTPVQAEILPLLEDLPSGLVALAQTGTGKTAGFGLPLIHHIDPSNQDTQALVLCPTRELCLQITDDFQKFMRYTKGIHITAVYGGASIDTQARQLNKGSQIVVGTPGRVLDMLKRRILKIGDLKVFVLDEADEMLNMGFKEDLEAIFKATPSEKSTWLFSATMPDRVESIVKRYITNPVRISTGKRNQGASNVTHEYYVVHAADRFEALRRILDVHPEIYGVVFCRTREETNAVAAKLNGMGFPAEALNGSLSQQQRDKVMARFRKQAITLLVATDVAARGIDVDDLTHVVNYSLPDDAEVYVHRSGRTGRAGKSGVSMSILHAREKYKIRDIERMTGKTLEHKQVPTLEDIGARAVAKMAQSILSAGGKGKSIQTHVDQVTALFDGLSREDIIVQIAKWAHSNALKGNEGAPDINVNSSSRSDEGNRRSDRGDRGERSERGSAGGRERRSNDRFGGERNSGEREGKGRDKNRESGSFKSSDGVKFTRLDLNLGAKDRLNPGKLMGILNDMLRSSDIRYGRIEINQTDSSIDVDSRYAPEIAMSLNGARYGSKLMRAELGDKPIGTSARPEKSFKSQGNNSRAPFKKRR
jgi:ATP-dependent RNA helicase DeaD